MTIGGAWVASSSAGPAPETVEVDVAPLTDTLAPSAAQTEPATPSPSRAVAPTHARPATRAVHAAPAPVSDAAPAATATNDAAPARFAMSAGTVASGPALVSTATSAVAASGSTSEVAALAEGDVDQRARLLAMGPLVYPSAARDAELEADVAVDLVVATDGRVVTARAASHAGYGLEDAAVRAVRGYRFSPALRAGRAVAVRMRWTVQFRLR